MKESVFNESGTVFEIVVACWLVCNDISGKDVGAEKMTRTTRDIVHRNVI